MLECDLPNTRLLALTPMPSPRIFRAMDTSAVQVRLRAIGVPVLSLSPLLTSFALIVLDESAILKRVLAVLGY